MDRRLRTLERRFYTTGDYADLLNYVAAMGRAGYVAPEIVEAVTLQNWAFFINGVTLGPRAAFNSPSITPILIHVFNLPGETNVQTEGGLRSIESARTSLIYSIAAGGADWFVAKQIKVIPQSIVQVNFPHDLTIIHAIHSVTWLPYPCPLSLASLRNVIQKGHVSQQLNAVADVLAIVGTSEIDIPIIRDRVLAHDDDWTPISFLKAINVIGTNNAVQALVDIINGCSVTTGKRIGPNFTIMEYAAPALAIAASASDISSGMRAAALQTLQEKLAEINEFYQTADPRGFAKRSWDARQALTAAIRWMQQPSMMMGEWQHRKYMEDRRRRAEWWGNNPKRRNPDEEMRRQERSAQEGDLEAAQKLWISRLRTGQIPLHYLTIYLHNQVWGRGLSPEESRKVARRHGGRGTTWITFRIPLGATNPRLDDFGRMHWEYAPETPPEYQQFDDKDLKIAAYGATARSYVKDLISRHGPEIMLKRRYNPDINWNKIHRHWQSLYRTLTILDNAVQAESLDAEDINEPLTRAEEGIPRRRSATSKFDLGHGYLSPEEAEHERLEDLTDLIQSLGGGSEGMSDDDIDLSSSNIERMCKFLDKTQVNWKSFLQIVATNENSVERQLFECLLSYIDATQGMLHRSRLKRIRMAGQQLQSDRTGLEKTLQLDPDRDAASIDYWPSLEVERLFEEF